MIDTMGKYLTNVNIPFFTDNLLARFEPVLNEALALDRWDYNPEGHGIKHVYFKSGPFYLLMKPFVDSLTIKPRSGSGVLCVSQANTFVHKHSA